MRRRGGRGGGGWKDAPWFRGDGEGGKDLSLSLKLDLDLLGLELDLNIEVSVVRVDASCCGLNLIHVGSVLGVWLSPGGIVRFFQQRKDEFVGIL